MKRLAMTVFLLSLTAVVFGQGITNTTTQTITQTRVGLGSIIASIISIVK